MSTRLAGLLLPVFSARREGDLGVGDTRALIEWIDLAADHGVRLLQMLPINEMGADDSPYNAISSVALEPLFLTMEEVPGVDRSALAAFAAETGDGPVEYPAVRKRKRSLLDAAWHAWSGAESRLHDEFAAFRASESEWLENYCVFRTLAEVAGTENWESWPEEWQRRDRARETAAAQGLKSDFFAWVQWLCFRQWRAVSRHAAGRGVKLMGDIPIGVSRQSADVFFARDDFDLDWCGGAPPEPYFKHDPFIVKWGQNWGVPLYRWGRMRKAGFPWWRRRIAKLTDVFHVFRIDHVLGFYRIYGFPWQPGRNDEFLPLSGGEAAEANDGVLPKWVPRPDDYQTNRDANRAEGELRLKMVLEAAGDADVVGEDLGCVPDYVRPSLASLGIAGFRIPHWDADEHGDVIPGDQLPECSFATYATHDHDSLPALWEDLRRRAKSGDVHERKDAKRERKRLATFAGIKARGKYSSEIGWALIDALMACRSRYAAIMVTDLFGLPDRINRPGTVGQENWSFRVPETADKSRERPEWKMLASSIAKGNR